MTRSLNDILKKEHFVLGSEHLKTLVVCVPRALVKDWCHKYETFSTMVVPRSTELITEDNENAIFTVTLFQKVEDTFRHKCRENKFVESNWNWKIFRLFLVQIHRPRFYLWWTTHRTRTWKSSNFGKWSWKVVRKSGALVKNSIWRIIFSIDSYKSDSNFRWICSTVKKGKTFVSDSLKIVLPQLGVDWNEF